MPFMGTGLAFLTKRPSKTAGKKKLKEPEDFNVLLLNDNYTSMEFVVDILMMVFHKDEADANRIMLDVHYKNKGLVGQYPFDIACTKVEQVHALAEKQGYPLRCIVEKV
jgi:ATP-dependent Clp protease adaptor protein ClpS